jgi:hypothetical protein
MAHIKTVNGILYIYRYDADQKKEIYCGRWTPEKMQEIILYELSIKQMKEIEEARDEKDREEDETSMDKEVLYPTDPRVREWAADPNKYDVIGIDTKVGLVKLRIKELEKELESIEKAIDEFEKRELIENLVERERSLKLDLERAKFLSEYPNTTSMIVMNPPHLKDVIEGKKKYALDIGREAEGFAKLGIPPRHVYDVGVNYFNGDVHNFGAAASYSRNSEFHLTGQLSIPFYRGKTGPSKEDQQTIRHEIGHHVHINIMLRDDDLQKYHEEWNKDIHPLTMKMNKQGTSSIQAYGDCPYETFAERYATYINGDMQRTTQVYKKRIKEMEKGDKLSKKEKMEKQRLQEIVKSSDEVIDYFERAFEAIEKMDLTEQ